MEVGAALPRIARAGAQLGKPQQYLPVAARCSSRGLYCCTQAKGGGSRRIPPRMRIPVGPACPFPGSVCDRGDRCGRSLLDWLVQARDTTEASGAKPRQAARRRLATAVTALLVGLGVLLMGIRAYGLVSDRAYLLAGEDALFGAGLSKSYPEDAAEFILRERLPGNIFNDYDLGGYLVFRLGPQYPD